MIELLPAGLFDRLVSLRRELHRHPELSFREEQTARRLERALDELGIGDHQRVAGTGVLARIPGRRSGGAVVAIRGDIDALPIEEATGLAFASEEPGVMHACGHDVHATWAVGAAALLEAEPAEGEVWILLQPAEEVASGAEAVLATGALDRVAAIFGAHVDRRFEVGQVVVQEGPLAAASDQFEIELVGKGSHGARPHEADDPIVGAASLVMALQTIVSRRLPPWSPAVVSVGSIQAGQAPNVIPERARLAGTLRSTDRVSRELLRSELERMAQATAALFHLEARVAFTDASPPLLNPPLGTSWARQAATRVLGAEKLVPLGITNMAGEDFACYLERMEGCFLRVGAREPGGEVIPAHSPRFDVAEGAIAVGAAVLAEAARVASRALAGA